MPLKKGEWERIDYKEMEYIDKTSEVLLEVVVVVWLALVWGKQIKSPVMK